MSSACPSLNRTAGGNPSTPTFAGLLVLALGLGALPHMHAVLGLQALRFLLGGLEEPRVAPQAMALAPRECLLTSHSPQPRQCHKVQQRSPSPAVAAAATQKAAPLGAKGAQW